MGKAPTATVVARASFGLAAWCGRAPSMGVAHRHNDIELNYLEHGSLSYRFGDRQVALEAGDLCLFWAARPHQLTAGEPAPQMHWVTLPLTLFLSWRLPDGLAGPLLRGTPLTWRRPAGERQAWRAITGWHADLAQGAPEQQQIVSLELEALLRRLALQLGAREGRTAGGTEGRGDSAERMAHFIVERSTEPLTVAQIAGHVGLHPHYAMQRFRETYGVSLMAYLTQFRVAHAQQLLATTDRGVLEIGLAAGFGSASRFHSAFRAACGVAPGAYRASLRLAG